MQGQDIVHKFAKLLNDVRRIFSIDRAAMHQPYGSRLHQRSANHLGDWIIRFRQFPESNDLLL